MRVVTRKQMKQLEEAAVRHDLTYHRLMENAGSAAAAFIRRTFKVAGLNCMVFCGSGNNGGDGFVVARKLSENGANVVLVLVDGFAKTPEAISMYNMVELMELPILDFTQHSEEITTHLERADIIVDAMYGTGFHGSLNETAAAACSAINSAIAAVVALDVPTGVTCDEGQADPHAVKADFTVAFDSLKPLHTLPASLPYCGVVEVVDIGIPDEARTEVEEPYTLLQTQTVWEHLPPRDPQAHKGTHGRLLCLCGSDRYRGAAVLSTLSALRSGVGLLTLAAPETVCAAVACAVYEATFLPLPQAADGTVDVQQAGALLAGPLSSATAVLLGCGCGNNENTARLLTYTLQNAKCPVVLDADGLNALAGNIHVRKEATAPLILTPHAGEMSRLCGLPVQEVLDDRRGAALRFAKEHGVVVVLKGPETVIAAPDGRLLVNRTGNAGLAKAGSGDLLAGMVASFAAQGVEPAMAAACAAHLHGLAADRTAARRSQYAMLPSELLEDLTALFVENGR